MASDADRGKTTLDENRRAERLSAELKVDYRAKGSFVTDYSANVSRRGVFIQTSHPLPVGEKVRLRLQLPEGGAPFALDGVVKWVRTGRGGHE
ncbi:MAG: TIGR02266 family protein, partial [Myxococcota bacterium]